jgi:hypothetical protein
MRTMYLQNIFTSNQMRVPTALKRRHERVNAHELCTELISDVLCYDQGTKCLEAQQHRVRGVGERKEKLGGMNDSHSEQCSRNRA